MAPPEAIFVGFHRRIELPTASIDFPAASLELLVDVFECIQSFGVLVLGAGCAHPAASFEARFSFLG